MLPKELIGITILLTSLISSSSKSIFLKNEKTLRSERFCLNPPTSCTCKEDERKSSVSTFHYSCSSDESTEKIEFKMAINSNDWISVFCYHVSSFKSFPYFTKYNNSTGISLLNFTKYNNITGISLENCTIPINEVSNNK